MKEEEWLATRQPWHLLDYLGGKVSQRKFRLFACICARRIWEAAEECRGLEMHSNVTLTEAFADGNATLAEMAAARENVWGVGEVSSFSCACYAGQAATEIDPVTAARDAASHAAEGFGMCAQEAAGKSGGDQRVVFRPARQAEYAVQVALIHDIFGNPFRPVFFSSSWRTDTALSLATLMYESRDFSAMPILADALQDAGCDSEDILNHCRDTKQVHVRGCWVVDLLLENK